MTLMNCDPATGSCRIPDAAPILPQGAKQAPGGEVTLRYIGDPMCSWCWGISSTLEELARYCEQKGIGFTLTMGGLRAGGATHGGRSSGSFYAGNGPISPRSPVNHSVFPCCRQSISTMTRSLPAEPLWSPSKCSTRSGLSPPRPWHFSAVQRKFYVEGEDPKNVDFYRSICEDASLSFEDFRAHFATAAARQAVYRQFAQCGEWGVRAFPTLLLDLAGDLKQLSSGATTAASVIERIEHLLGARTN